VVNLLTLYKMKKYFLYAAFISTVVFSCKKDSTAPTPVSQDNSKKYDVTFNVTGFSQSQAPFSIYAATPNKMASTNTQPDTLAQSIGVLYYSITDSKGVLVSKLTQHASDSTFGKIKLPLAPGSYHVSVVGGRYPNASRTDVGNLIVNPDTADQFVYQTLYFQRKLSFDDTFRKSMDITVGNTDSSYNMILDRIVAQVEVNIQDAIPANAKSIYVTIVNDHYILKADGTSEGPTGQVIINFQINNDITITPSAGSTNTKIFRTVLNTQSAMTVKITCYDSNHNIIAYRTIDNVTCQPNHTTLLTGNLFTNSSGGGVGVSYNAAWNVQTLNYAF
jgi:hypothetical protein